jgi:hypothetical protein
MEPGWLKKDGIIKTLLAEFARKGFWGRDGTF